MAAKKKETAKKSELNIFEYFKKELGSKDIDDVEEFIPTGSTLLDYIIANKPNGGIPVGRITEISGNEATGKSLLAYHILANTQKKGGLGVYIDTERAANRKFMERMGIDLKKLIVPPKIPGSIEEVFDYIEKIIKVVRDKFPEKNKLVTVVWDSIAATPSREEIEIRHMDKSRLAPEARSMSRSLRKVIEALDEGFVTLVCVNQLREKTNALWGDPEVTPGGKALPFYASCRIKLKSMKQIKDKTLRTIGVKTQAKVFKNKVGPNHRTVDFPIMYDWGVDDSTSLMELMIDLNTIEARGPWKNVKVGENEEYKFQGSNGWKDLFKNKNIKEFVSKTLENSLIIKFEKMPELEELSDSIVKEE